MIFASDLDRTIIYSKDFLKGDVCTQPIEFKDNQVISYMTHKSISLLNELTQKALFVPVTTRTKLQYKRVEIVSKCTNIRYAICNNGGTLLVDNCEDAEYSKMLHKLLKQNTEEYEKVFEMARIEIPENDYIEIKSVDNLFFYFILSNIPDNKRLDEISEQLYNINWKLYLTNRKLYFLPNIIKKSLALNYLSEKLGHDYSAAGDSTLDIDMLNEAKYAVIPAHAEELAQSINKKCNDIYITKKSGMEAGEEVISFYLSML